MLVLKKFARDLPAVAGLLIVLAVVAPRAARPVARAAPGGRRRLASAAAAEAALRRVSVRHRQSRARPAVAGRFSARAARSKSRSSSSSIAAGIGVPLGLVAGYRSGWLSEAIMRVTDVFLALPQLILALALAQLMTPSLETAMIALALTYWPFFTRLVYAETRRLQASLFVDALRGIGAGDARILFLHILPNAVSPIIVRATIGMGFTILVAAVLGFLGMGATPPAPDWGLTIAESRNYLPGAWWYSIFPGARDPGHGARLQPARRRACAISSIRASGARDDRPSWPTRSSKSAASGCRSAPTRASRASSTISISRSQPGHILGVVGESGCGKSTVVRADARHPAARARRSKPARSALPAQNLLALGESRAQPAHPRQPHRLCAAGPLSGAEPGLQDRRAASRNHALARARGGRQTGRAPRRICCRCSAACNCPTRRRRSNAIRTSSRAGSGSGC